LALARNELRYETYLADTYRPAFDGMRGVGFLLVITAHIPSVPLFGYLQGWAAVWLFLVISGYLVTMLLMREEKSQGRVAFGPFLIKRFFRIVPAYWTTNFIYLAVCRALPPFADDYEQISGQWLYLFGFLPEYANKRIAITAMAAALLLAIATFRAQTYLAILCGALLAMVLERPRGYATIAMLTRVPVALPLGLIAALLVMLRYTEQLTAVALVATYLVAYAILQKSALLSILTWKPLAYLGQRSYGAYLLHFLTIRIGYLLFPDGTALSGVLTACFCLAVTVPAAELMYRLIEAPSMSYGRRLLKSAQAITAR
jgi:peptidoglycan/LPS O-acetylase OafA/YrhL